MSSNIVFPSKLESLNLLLKHPNQDNIFQWFEGVEDTIQNFNEFPHSWPLYTKSPTSEMFVSLCKQKYPPYFVFNEQHNIFVGVIEIVRIESDFIEIGFWTRRSYHNRGIMTEALNCFITWFEHSYPFVKIVIGIESANKAAIKIAEKVGFVWDTQYINVERNNTVYEIFHFGTKE